LKTPITEQEVYDDHSRPLQVEAEEFYDGNLTPQSTLAYESLGALIETPEIRTLSGNRVNCLKRGQTYLYTYRVKFLKGASNVRFTMLIKTTSGVNLGGAISAADLTSGIPYIAPDSEARMEIKFNCALTPGCYFINCGVLGIVDSEEVVLHRILDASMFRVLHDDEKTILGIIDFGCNADIILPRSNSRQ
jgi:lipopolysaccharide transport system ATP-binding protein